MALKQNTTLELPGASFEIKGAYLRTEDFVGNKFNLHFTLKCYVSSDETQHFKQQSFSFTPASDKRWDAQAYEYLKTQPEFAGATDC